MVATRPRHFGRGRGSGVEIDTELYHQVATFRRRGDRADGVRTSWPEALEALAGQVALGDPPRPLT